MAAYDFAVIGAGIAGASAAYELARMGSTILLERERMPGYHSTGRSAAVLTENYGVEVIRKLTAGSREFLASPPPDIADHALLHPRPVMWLARADQLPALDVALETARRLVPSIHRIDSPEAVQLCPALRPEYAAGGLLEPDAMDIDVSSLHQGYLRAYRKRGGKIRTDFEVVRMVRCDCRWTLESPHASVSCSVAVNAAGAWCDQVAELAGAQPVGLTPKRRTAFVFNLSGEWNSTGWPTVIDADEQFYFKPEGKGLLGSPADATPVAPCDAQPEMIDIALAIDRIQRATCLTIDRVRNRWAGLRSFAPDNAPVAGMDPELPGFFWLAGQGGYGIMTSPALARATAGLIEHGDLPEDLRDLGLAGAALGPRRLHRRANG